MWSGDWAPTPTPIATIVRGAGGALHPNMIGWAMLFWEFHAVTGKGFPLRFTRNCVVLLSSTTTPMLVTKSIAVATGAEMPKFVFVATVLFARLRTWTSPEKFAS